MRERERTTTTHRGPDGPRADDTADAGRLEELRRRRRELVGRRSAQERADFLHGNRQASGE